ncbi:MAG: DUF6478 family protein [Pseudomonadota bacterium]
MAKNAGFFERLTHKRSLQHWMARAESAKRVDFDELKDHQKKARTLRRLLDEVLFVADDRLTLPRPGSQAFQTPTGTDWSWRPPLWRGPAQSKGAAGIASGFKVTDGTTIFHDCQNSDLTYRQVRNTRKDDLAAYGARLDVFDFDGSFLSMVVDLPDDCHAALQRTHLFRLNAVLESERPLEIFARLNVKHGPNVEQIVRELPLHQDDVWVEFDLGYTKINEKRVEKIWVDLIFEGPQMNQITLRDVTLSRGRRSEL